MSTVDRCPEAILRLSKDVAYVASCLFIFSVSHLICKMNLIPRYLRRLD